MKWYECSKCGCYFQDTVKLPKPHRCENCRPDPCQELPPAELIIVLVGALLFLITFVVLWSYMPK